MDKEADLKQILSDVGSSFQDKTQGGREALQGFMSGMSTNQQRALKNALLGALVGGGTAGGLGALGAEPGERGGAALRNALTGALLGGVAGGGGTAGYDLLTGAEKFRTEEPISGTLAGRLMDEGSRSALTNPGKYVGAGLGAAGAYKLSPNFRDYEGAIDDWVARAAKGSAGDPRRAQGAAASARAQNIRSGPGVGSRVMGELNRARAAGERPDMLKIKRLLGMGTKSTRLRKVLRSRGIPPLAGKNLAALGLIPAGLGAGYLVVRYLKGDY